MTRRRPTEVPLPMRPFSASLPMGLLQAREGAMRLFRPMLADYDLTEQQWRVLRALSASEASLAVGDVADRTFLLGPSLSRIVAALEARGLLERTPGVGDQRRSLLGLTAAGHRLVAEVAPHSEATYAAIETCFGRARLQGLLAELGDLAAAIGDIEPRAASAVEIDR